jgi:spermidine synthase
VRESLADVGFAQPEALLATRVLDDEALRHYVGDATPMRDDRLAVEFYCGARDGLFRVDDVLRRAQIPYANGADASLLEDHVAAERLGMRAWDVAAHGGREEARRMVLAAQRMVPRDPWWDYLGALEFGCLDLDDP